MVAAQCNHPLLKQRWRRRQRLHEGEGPLDAGAGSLSEFEGEAVFTRIFGGIALPLLADRYDVALELQPEDVRVHLTQAAPRRAFGRHDSTARQPGCLRIGGAHSFPGEAPGTAIPSPRRS